MKACVTAGAGFLLAVLWFDLMFDVQVLRRPERELPDEVLASIAGYYRRVTTAARPMNRLVAAVMLGTIVAIVLEITDGAQTTWVPWTSLGLALAPILLAGLHTVPCAVRLGARADPPERQSSLARAVLRDHLLCIASIAAVLAVQLSAG